MIKATITDQNGTPRCWAEGRDMEELLNQSIKACSEYMSITGRTELNLHLGEVRYGQHSKPLSHRQF